MKKQVTKLGIAALIGASTVGCSSYSQSPMSVQIRGKVIDKSPVIVDTTQSNSTTRKGLLISNLDTTGIAYGDSIHFNLDTVTKVAKSTDITIIKNLN